MKKVATSEVNREKFFDTRDSINKVLRKYKYTRTVAVDIYGKIEYMDEAHVRTLQLLAKRAAEKSDEAFTEFCDNVKVYSGATITKSDHVMHFRKDGRFSDEFDKGFYDVNCELAFEIL